MENLFVATQTEPLANVRLKTKNKEKKIKKRIQERAEGDEDGDVA